MTQPFPVEVDSSGKRSSTLYLPFTLAKVLTTPASLHCTSILAVIKATAVTSP